MNAYFFLSLTEELNYLRRKKMLPICPECHETVAPGAKQVLNDREILHQECWDFRRSKERRQGLVLLLTGATKQTLRVTPHHLPPAA